MLTTVRSEDNGPPAAQRATLSSIGRANDSPGSQDQFSAALGLYYSYGGLVWPVGGAGGGIVEVELEVIQCHHHHFNSFYFQTLPFPVILAPSIIVN